MANNSEKKYSLPNNHINIIEKKPLVDIDKLMHKDCEYILFEVPKGFDKKVAECVSELTGKKFVTAPNKFHALTSKDELVYVHGAIKALAADMMKIANDVRWLASGPRDGVLAPACVRAWRGCGG